MAKAALENAVWDLEAQIEAYLSGELLGGTRDHDSVWRLDRDPADAGAADGQGLPQSWPLGTSASS